MDWMPYLPTVKAMEPKAPNGASFIKKPNTVNRTCEKDSIHKERLDDRASACESEPISMASKRTGKTSLRQRRRRRNRDDMHEERDEPGARS